MPGHSTPEVSARQAIALFTDEHFKATFGHTFDALTGGALHKIENKLQNIRGKRASAADEILYNLSGMFSTQFGSQSGHNTLQGVHALRTIASWATTLENRLANLKGGPSDWKLAQSMKTSLDQYAGAWLLPEEASRLGRAVSAALTRLARPALDSKLEDLATMANRRTRLNALSQFELNERQILEHCDPVDRSEIAKRVAQLIETTVSEDLARYAGELERLGSGLMALEAGGAWYRRLTNEFAAAEESPSYIALLARYRTRRNQDLEDARPELLARVSISNSQEIAQLDDRCFLDWADQRHPTFYAFLDAIKDRKSELESSYTRRVAEAVEQARGEAKRTGRPLRFIDFDSLPLGDFLKFIYYGTGGNPTQEKFLNALSRQDMESIIDSAQYFAKIKIAFTAYHDVYYQWFGRTPELRAASGERWVGIVEGQNVNSEPYMYVRSRYSDAYLRATATQLDGLALLAEAAMDAARNERSPKKQNDRFFENLLGSTLLGPLEYRNAYSEFLLLHAKEYPSTVRHFEENLRRAFSLAPLVPIEAIRVDR